MPATWNLFSYIQTTEKEIDLDRIQPHFWLSPPVVEVYHSHCYSHQSIGGWYKDFSNGRWTPAQQYGWKAVGLLHCFLGKQLSLFTIVCCPLINPATLAPAPPDPMVSAAPYCSGMPYGHAIVWSVVGRKLVFCVPPLYMLIVTVTSLAVGTFFSSLPSHSDVLPWGVCVYVYWLSFVISKKWNIWRALYLVLSRRNSLFMTTSPFSCRVVVLCISY